MRILRSVSRSSGRAAVKMAEFFGTSGSPYFRQTAILAVLMVASSPGGRERMREMISRYALTSSMTGLMFGCNFLGSSFRRIVHHRHLLVVDMGNDLVPEREESILMGFFIFMNMDRRDLKGVIAVGVNFFVGDSFVVFLDVNHQHVEME
jgi:hypothetical protein